MIDYSLIKRGDILRVVGMSLPGYALLGDLVRVKSVTTNSVLIEDKNGREVECVYNCGAKRLEPTEWRDDFPDPTKGADDAGD